MNTDKEIEKLRRKVDAFDDRILDILVQRLSVVKEIGQIKSISTINIDHPDREKEIIAYTGMAGPDETVTVEFTVPEIPGKYEYICTFPGHYLAGMKGILIIIK